jgi:RNA polymerase sigma-70 factor (ECF subfamily)
MSLSEGEIKRRLNEIAQRTPKPVAERAIESLYLEFSLPVRNYVWKNWFQDPEEIEEVLQDCFWDVWKQPERFRGDSKFKTWLLSIARNKSVDRLRKSQRAADLTQELDDTVENTLAADLAPLVDVLQREQVRESLSLCMDSLGAAGKLSVAQREVLHLAYVEDLDIGEMAAIVGCPENTVKTRLHHARLRIKDCLARRLSGAI